MREPWAAAPGWAQYAPGCIAALGSGGGRFGGGRRRRHEGRVAVTQARALSVVVALDLRVRQGLHDRDKAERQHRHEDEVKDRAEPSLDHLWAG